MRRNNKTSVSWEFSVLLEHPSGEDVVSGDLAVSVHPEQSHCAQCQWTWHVSRCCWQVCQVDKEVWKSEVSEEHKHWPQQSYFCPSQVGGWEGGRKKSFITRKFQSQVCEVSSEGSCTVTELTEGIRGGTSVPRHCEERQEQRDREQLRLLSGGLGGSPSSQAEVFLKYFLIICRECFNIEKKDGGVKSVRSIFSYFSFVFKEVLPLLREEEARRERGETTERLDHSRS